MDCFSRQEQGRSGGERPFQNAESQVPTLRALVRGEGNTKPATSRGAPAVRGVPRLSQIAAAEASSVRATGHGLNEVTPSTRLLIVLTAFEVLCDFSKLELKIPLIDGMVLTLPLFSLSEEARS